ncbi:MAG TPA: hypothetical protein ACFCUC_17015 [Desulfobacterales bacterium]
MQKMALVTLIMVVFSVLLACAAPQPPPASTTEPLQDAGTVAPESDPTLKETGPGPLPENYAEMIVEYLQNNLIDPDSIRDLEIGEPEIKVSEQGKSGNSENEPGTRVWQVPVWFDAKSQSGKYTGRQLSHAVFKDGEIITFY